MIIGHSMTDKESIRKIIEKEGAKIYFCGIGGISMSALAEMSLENSKRVFGSDIKRSSVTDRLESLGIRIKYIQSRANVMEAMPQLFVYSLSISPSNPEYLAAKSLGITAVSRAEYLGALMELYGTRIGVSGSHGKSTVSAMLGSVLSYAKLSPSILCGAEILGGTGYISGNRKYLVYEACEYGDSFLHFSPDIQILLNLDFDHPDYFENIDALKSSFIRLANNTKGLVIINADDENLKSIIPYITSHVCCFSKESDTEYRYFEISSEKGRFTFDLFFEDKSIGRYTLSIPGEFNIGNAVSAIIASRYLGIPNSDAAGGIESFYGISRRLERLGNFSGVDVFYDYAHHPCEIEATYKAIKDMGYRSVATIFSPHTYSRTKSLFMKFADALAKFDKVYITDIYGARESAVVGVSSISLSNAVCERGGNSSALADNLDVRSVLMNDIDCLVLMGAGNLDTIKTKIEEL